MNNTSKSNTKNIAIIALFSAMGIAIKLVAAPLKLVTGSIGIPGGALVGGLYMMWLPLVVALTGILFSASIVSLAQAVLAFLVGLSSSFGLLTIPIYLASGIVCDIVMLLFNKKYNMLAFVTATMLANLAGTYATNIALFNLPLIPLLITLVTSMLSGAIGGVLGYLLYKQFIKTKVKTNE